MTCLIITGTIVLHLISRSLFPPFYFLRSIWKHYYAFWVTDINRWTSERQIFDPFNKKYLHLFSCNTILKGSTQLGFIFGKRIWHVPICVRFFHHYLFFIQHLHTVHICILSFQIRRKTGEKLNVLTDS